jgi:hypothetical protein
VKEKLEPISMADEDQFLPSLQDILKYIDQEELNGGFQAWMRCVREGNQGNRDYMRR